MSAVDERRERIADAVIDVLAERGSRGLTHRAVDEVAGLPTGSTSYYFRTRAALLAAAVPRLAELDVWALDGSDQHQQLVAILHDALHGAGRRRTLARYELVLEAARRPEIQRAMAEGNARVIQRVAALFPAASDAEAQRRARDVLALVDGLLLLNVTCPEQQRIPAEEIAASVVRVLELP
ncbi:TetR/AcrR family transcriptional regulator [Brachybacterium sp. GCM10030267]|uniref:TetR/AcrR family transcriptional regulator n=1 Tax=Brachybacterium sp. GCM10030267 TaxID=3273381 RepID=UPI003616F11F